MTLTGPAGIGKTRLAIEAARQLRSRFPGGVWWIDLAPVAEPVAVPDEMARVLSVSPTAGPELVQALVRALSRRRALLLIDNCEHVAAAAAEVVTEVLGGTTGPQVLTTSRTPLRVEGERLWPVPPLSLPPEDLSAERMQSDAVRLFVERGQSVDSSFALGPGNVAAVAEVCRKLDGISLAIEMAAARVSILTPQEIARLLDDRFALLELPAAGRLTRHRTLEAALDANYSLLSEDERAVFERLTAFVGPFDLEAVAAVGFEEPQGMSRALAVVSAVVDASMIDAERHGEQTRYRILETLREYGAARLKAAGREDDARRAHAEYHLDLTARAGAVHGTPGFAPWIPRLAQSYAEIRQALAWSLDNQARAVTLRAAPALREFWFRRGDAREAGRWAARMLEGDVESVPPGLLAEAHNAAAFAADLANDFPSAATHADEAVRLSHEGGATPGLVHGLFGRAQVALALGDFDSVRQRAMEAIAACDQHGDRWGRAGPLAVLGFAAVFGGKFPEARPLLAEALPLYRELGDLGGLVMMTLTPLTLAALGQRDVHAAERYATEALEVGRGTGWEASALNCYGEVLSATGDLEGAEAVTLRALQIALETGLETCSGPRCATSRARLPGRVDTKRRRCSSPSRRNMPVFGLDPAFYGPVEEQCRDAIGNDRFEHVAERGQAMSHQELMDLVGANDPRIAATTGEPLPIE